MAWEGCIDLIGFDFGLRGFLNICLNCDLVDFNDAYDLGFEDFQDCDF
jgi:hypothetical protein